MAPASTPTGRPAGSYRPDIDGLRAVAVLAVILFHFNEKLLPSGFLGVDVFFVISGFVISASLARRQESHLRPFLLAFYARRVKRLLPLLIVCVLLTSLVGALVMTPGSAEATATWQTGIGALFGAGNLVLHARQLDYFAPATGLNLFTHTWSLGVEEQFYVLFPFIVFASGFVQGAAGGGRRLAWILLVISGASLVGWLVLNQSNPGLAYYLFPVRFWEMAAGALAFLAWRARPPAAGPVPALASTALGLALLALLLVPKTQAVTSTVAAVLVTAGLLWALQPHQISARLLGTAPMRQIGLLSYALYLWHWSVLSISAWTVGIHPWTVPFQVGLILLLALWSHHTIETPLRQAPWGGTSGRTILYGFMAVALSSLVIAGQAHGLEGRLFAGDAGKVESTPWEQRVGIGGTAVTGEHCNTGPEVAPGPFKPYQQRCTTSRRATDRQRLFLLGDSHALALLPLAERLHNQLPLQITHYSRKGCPMPPSAFGHESSGCWAFSQQALAAVLAEVGPGDLVLVHNYFRSHFGEGEDSRSMQLDAQGRHIRGEEAKLAPYRTALASLAETLEAKGASLVIVADVPRFLSLKVDRNLCVRQWFRPWLPPSCQQPMQQSLASHRSDTAPTARLFAGLEAGHPNVHVFDPAAVLCSKGLCRTHDSAGELLYRDRDHLSEWGVGQLAEPLAQWLKTHGLLAPGKAPGNKT